MVSERRRTTSKLHARTDPESGAEPRAPASGASSKLEPRDLAALLDRWALKREKVLEVLDLKVAKRARNLAIACRTLQKKLDQSSGSDRESLALAWLELRAEVVGLLTPGNDKPEKAG